MRIKIDKTKDLKLNLGCGKKCVDEYIGIDIQDNGQEIVWDITKGIPLADDCVIELISSHVVEHIATEDIEPLIKEMIRVSAPGAIWAISCPHSDSDQAYFACHVSLWDERRWRGICEDSKSYPEGKIRLINTERRGIEIVAHLEVIK